MSNKPQLHKVIFKITGDDPSDQWTETMWAESVGNDEYILQNSPFHAYGVSYLDKVKTENEFEGFPLFKEIVEKSGNSTVRIMVFNETSHPLFEQFWKPLEELGCTHENANSKLISVNVPPEADMTEVSRLLEGGVKLNFWDFEEADKAQ